MKTSPQTAAAGGTQPGVRGGGAADGNATADDAGRTGELLSALAGLDANRERTVAHRTRRVVQSSLGVIQERNHSKSRARAVALAVIFVVLLLITPLIWELADSFIAGEHLAEDAGGQLSLLALVLCPTILAAALVAGWWRRNRS